jgi:hypothetical protein
MTTMLTLITGWPDVTALVLLGAVIALNYRRLDRMAARAPTDWRELTITRRRAYFLGDARLAWKMLRKRIK